jgi:UDP-2,4-diacetamido-2,4,6-trideoxy-beta-L-altropyranose hydrolase
MTPRVVIATEASDAVGLGHLRRCLSLGMALRARGMDVLVALDGGTEAMDLVAEAQFEGVRVDGRSPVDVVRIATERALAGIVADSYRFDAEYLTRLRTTGAVVVAIDDCADRSLPVDLVVNSAVGVTTAAYVSITAARLLLGPRYVLLRPVFRGLAPHAIRESVERVLITVGGSDPRALTGRLIDSIRQHLPSSMVDVVAGPFGGPCHPLDDQTVCHVNPRAIHELMAEADLAICAGGQTAYELAAVGTPAIAVRTADNQTRNLKGLQEVGCTVWAGEASDAEIGGAVSRIAIRLAGDAGARRAMSTAGQQLVDGCGATRVADAIAELCWV